MSIRVRGNGDRRREGRDTLVRTRPAGQRREIVGYEITWQRDAISVGAVAPRSGYEAWNLSWSNGTGTFLGSFGAQIPGGSLVAGSSPPRTQGRMAPLRYRYGASPNPPNIYRWSNTRFASSPTAATTLPPTRDGHIRSVTVTEMTLRVPMVVMTYAFGAGYNTGWSWCLASTVDAIEVWLNGASVKLFPITGLALTRNILVSATTWFLPEVVLSFSDTPIVLSEDDLVEIDIYTSCIDVITGVPDYRALNPAFLWSGQPYWNFDVIGMYMGSSAVSWKANGALTRARYEFHKLDMVFSNNGPGGLQSLKLGDYYNGLGSGVPKVSIAVAGIAIIFDATREIPFIELAYSLSLRVRYYPTDSGHYETMLMRDNLYGGLFPPVGTTPVAYGVWNPQQATVFSAPHRLTDVVLSGAFAWLAPPTLPASYFTDFPASITLQPIA